MESHDPRLAALCRPFAEAPEVILAYLFGSRAEGREHPDSDWDIAIVTDAHISYARRFELELAAQQRLGGGRVQVITMDSAPIELRYRVVATGMLLFARSVELRVEWEATTMSRYFDALPGLRQWRADLIKGGNSDAAVRRYRKQTGKAQRLREPAGGDPDDRPDRVSR